MTFDDGSVLEILPAEVLREGEEHWRLVDIDGPHLVVGNASFYEVD